MYNQFILLYTWNITALLFNYTPIKKKKPREFPGGPVVKIQHFQCWGPGLIPGQGTNIPQAMQQSQTNK